MDTPYQLDLFQKPAPPQKPLRYYKDLNIHERINVKANSCGFAMNYLREGRRYFATVHYIRSDEHPEGLHWKKILSDRKLNLISFPTVSWRKSVLKANAEKGLFKQQKLNNHNGSI